MPEIKWPEIKGGQPIPVDDVRNFGEAKGYIRGYSDAVKACQRAVKEATQQKLLPCGCNPKTQYCDVCKPDPLMNVYGLTRKEAMPQGLVPLDRKRFEEETKKFFRWNRGGYIHSAILESDAQKYYDHICQTFASPKPTTPLNEHNLIQFLTGWGINHASKLGKEICKHFASPVKVPSVQSVENIDDEK